jgi:hypothetical protein
MLTPYKCPRCKKPLDDKLLPDWNGHLVCGQCVWDSIPEQPPLSKQRIQEIVDYALTVKTRL